MRDAEESFAKVAELLLGRQLSPLIAYVKWLEQGLPAHVVEKKSRISGKPAFTVSLPFYNRMGNNIATLEEALALGEKSLTGAEVEKLSLANAGQVLSKISTTSQNVVFGENFDVLDSACYGPVQHCYRLAFSWWSKYCSCSYWVRTSEHMYGCSDCDDCSFCMKCRQSSKLQRCFEMDSCSNCSDCHFCHDCESLTDCMFCFNARNMRYAIGNVQYSREEYMKAKAMLQQGIGTKLEKDKKLEMSIYNIGARK